MFHVYRTKTGGASTQRQHNVNTTSTQRQHNQYNPFRSWTELNIYRRRFSKVPDVNDGAPTESEMSPKSDSVIQTVNKTNIPSLFSFSNMSDFLFNTNISPVKLISCVDSIIEEVKLYGTGTLMHGSKKATLTFPLIWHRTIGFWVCQSLPEKMNWWLSWIYFLYLMVSHLFPLAASGCGGGFFCSIRTTSSHLPFFL